MAMASRGSILPLLVTAVLVASCDTEYTGSDEPSTRLQLIGSPVSCDQCAYLDMAVVGSAADSVVDAYFVQGFSDARLSEITFSEFTPANGGPGVLLRLDVDPPAAAGSYDLVLTLQGTQAPVRLDDALVLVTELR